MKFTLEDLKKSACGHLNPHILGEVKKKAKGKKVAKHYPRKNKALDFIGWNLLVWANERAVVLEQEYRFSDTRKYRFDWAIPSLKLAVEYEGGIFLDKGGHNTAKGVTRDSDKYNLAQSLGWKVLRFTALNYTSLITELNETL